MTINRRLFGTDGVRGRANVHPMTVETALALGKAIGYVLREGGSGKRRVVIGKDTRLSGYMFENALIAGLCSMGVDTLMVGPLPTPGVAFITRAYRADAGFVISASHNPYYDNGIKIFNSEGYKFPDSVEEQIEKIIDARSYEERLPKDHALGRNTRIDDAGGRYIEFIKSTFPRKMTLRGLRIVLDCAHGAAHRVAPLVFKELDAVVFNYGNHPNGTNINEGHGALHPNVVQKGVLDHKADLGIALDGDADRLILVDELGEVVDGDVILAICAEDMLRGGVLENKRVVGTVMTNFGVVKHLESLGIETLLANVGDRYVLQEMLAHRSNLGGEQSGHLIFLDHNTTGDGLVSALQVLRIMRETGRSLSELAKKVKRFPQSLVNVRVTSKPPIASVKRVTDAISQAETALGGEGRVLVRYSGTEPLCRVMVEGAKKRQVITLAKEIAESVKQAIGVA